MRIQPSFQIKSKSIRTNEVSPGTKSKSIETKAMLIFTFLLGISCLYGQVASSFEARYYSKDKINQGITDFKGETASFTTAQRVEFLSLYAATASAWFLDSAMDTRVNDQGEIDRFLEHLKTRPLPDKRRRIVLEDWQKTGFGAGDQERSARALSSWEQQQGVSVENGALKLMQPGVTIARKTDSIRWRMQLSWRAMNPSGKVPMSMELTDQGRPVAEVGFHSNGNIFFSSDGFDRMGATYMPGKWVHFRIEADLVNDRYNLFVDDRKIGDWVPMRKSALVDGIRIKGGQGIMIDDLTGILFDTTGCGPSQPYFTVPFLQENFDLPPAMDEWYLPGYNDSQWTTGKLPIVHGGVLEAGEDLFLRKEVSIGEFEKAWLNIESLDPGGEIWINGRVVFVTHERYPVKIDISEFLAPYRINTLAIRVYSYYNDGQLYHSPLDRNVGWFCGRAWIDLTEQITIDQVQTYTRSILPDASQFHKVVLKNHSDTTFRGTLQIDYYPWFPAEGSRKSASFSIPVQIFARDTVHINHKGNIADPLLWTHDNPNLYRVHTKLYARGVLIDDEMLTTGIRTVSQEEGIFRINGEPELLGGAQTMGFRMPIENNAKWNRCPPATVLADELLACKKLGNTLRIHVHAGGTYAHSINDPRIAEMADQLGLMLIWPTSSWIREGEWGGIDFDGYPQYMEQVFNHPSIVMWEGANHPNRFGDKPLEYSNRFITKIYRTISGTDSSRLISPTSYNRHLAYANDAGTADHDGNVIVPCDEWTAPLIVRGNQDALTGYGAEWDKIRKWPDPYRKSFLESRERAYFNFEHEESIGMQNFELVRGKPWYQLPSYENIYDVGSIGRPLEFSEWRISQAWQAFSAWESMKWQRIHDIDGFSWCCLHGGPNSGTYRKPLIDAMGHAKLSYYINRVALADVMAGSNNTDVVYHKRDALTPVIMNVGEERAVRLKIIIRSADGTIVDEREFKDITLPSGRTVTELNPFRPKFGEEGYYTIEYYVLSS